MILKCNTSFIYNVKCYKLCFNVVYIIDLVNKYGNITFLYFMQNCYNLILYRFAYYLMAYDIILIYFLQNLGTYLYTIL